MVPTVKDLYASFAVLYIAPSGKTTNSPASPHIEQACSLFDPLVIFFLFVPLNWTQKGHCVSMYQKKLLKSQYRICPFFKCVTLLFFHFRPFASSAKVISFEV